ncbi:MAG: 50S ribosomal protein L25 [Planctomycetota bacterium]|jgi:large subunit ribosomal protein L25
MAQSLVLNAVERPDYGTRVARKLRKSGLVPAVIYGHKEANVAVSIKSDEVAKAIRTGVRLVDLKLGEKSLEKALIRDVQWDYLGADILHVDFARVGADERIAIDVRVELRGIAPGVAHGGNLIQPLHSLHVECLVTNIPESIRVSINELDLNQSIHVKELKLPEGVTVMNEADAIVVQVVPQQVEAEAPIVDTSEPEVIGRTKAEEEAEAEEKK